MAPMWLKRRLSIQKNRQHRYSDRRRRQNGAIAMAFIALAALWRLRVTSESYSFVLFEGIVVALGLLAIAAWNRRRMREQAREMLSEQRDQSRWLSIGCATLAPWLTFFVLRWLQLGTGFELIMMSSLSWGALAASLWPPQPKALSISIVCSGFLVLFITCSSDHGVAVLYAYAWGLICLWWLVANHWEQVQGCQTSVQVETLWYRPISLVCGVFVFAAAIWFVAGRTPGSNRLNLEWMPTSGGTTQKDLGARGGVGDGDEVVAARRQVPSFAAVESEFFLDSNESSLFDVFSEALGEPVKRNRTERSVALSAMNETSSETKESQSKGNQANFSLQRESPKHSHAFENVASDAVLRWVGRSQTLLAIERFNEFDGVEWSAPSAIESLHLAQRRVTGESFEGRFWCSRNDQIQNEWTPFVGARHESIKFVGLRTARIPTSAGYHSWSISQVDDPTLFGVDALDGLWMPGREHVPDFTVVNFINRELDLGKLIRSVNQLQKDTELASAVKAADGSIIKSRLLDHLSLNQSNWDVIQGVIGELRQHYNFDRNVDLKACEKPIELFFNQRRGNDLQFATIAALALRQLGFQTRLVNGFFVSPERRIGIAEEFNVLPQDAHVWLELNVGQGNWIPLEPTPGYPQPQYHISWRQWISESANTIMIGLSAVGITSGIVYWQRLRCFDALCWFMQFLFWLGSDRQRTRWLLHIMDWRCQLAGKGRPKHQVPRQWLQQLLSQNQDCNLQANEWQRAVQLFFSEADRIWFGTALHLSESGRKACAELWVGLTGTRLQRFVKGN